MSKIKQKSLSPALSAGGLHTFLGAYQTYQEECAQFERNWGPDTQMKYESAIKNRIVPYLRNHDHTPIQDYSKEDFLNVIERLKRVGQHNDPGNFVPYEESTLEQFLHIMKTVVTVTSLHEYFVNVFEEETCNQQNAATDQIQRAKHFWLTSKSLSVSEEKKVANYLLTNMEACGENVALFLMYAVGLRNEEACGVNFGHINEIETYPGNYYLRIPQTTENHTNVLKLGSKSYNGYRNIPLPQLAVKVLFELRRKRMHAIQKCSPKNIAIDNVSIAYKGKRELIRCGADSVTRQAQKMFESLGMRKRIAEISEYLQQDKAVLEEEQIDIDEFAQVEKEPTAYLLRRNFATHMAILQLTESELAYVLGHVIEGPQIKRSDFLDDRELFSIKQKMDKRPILNDVGDFSQITLTGNATVQTARYSNDFVVPHHASRVKLAVTATEPHDSIYITVAVSEGTVIHEEVGIHGTPYPHHFAKTADVLKYYHIAFAQSDTTDKV